MNPLVAAPVGVVAVLVASVSVYRAFRADARSRELPTAAARAGLEFSEVDRFNSAAVAFPLFREGTTRTVSNVMWRAEDRDGEGSPTARVFDFTFVEIRPDRSGAGTQVSHGFSCALAQHNGDWPPIRIAPEGLVFRAMQKLGLPDIDFESEEFNRTFTVQCPDRRFASALIDPQMMTFLLSTGGELTFETKGRFLLVTSAPLEAAAMPGLLHAAEEVLRLVPPVVRELYPSFPDGAGTEVFPGPPVDPIRRPPGWTNARWDSLREFDGETPLPFEFAPPSRLRDPEADPWDPTPGVDHDLDGHVVDPVPEDPWHDHPLPPHQP